MAPARARASGATRPSTKDVRFSRGVRIGALASPQRHGPHATRNRDDVRRKAPEDREDPRPFRCGRDPDHPPQGARAATAPATRPRPDPTAIGRLSESSGLTPNRPRPFLLSASGRDDAQVHEGPSIGAKHIRTRPSARGAGTPSIRPAARPFLGTVDRVQPVARLAPHDRSLTPGPSEPLSPPAHARRKSRWASLAAATW